MTLRTTKDLLAVTFGFALVVSAARTADAQTASPLLAASAVGPIGNQALAKRWAEMFSFLLNEFRADGRDPTGILQGDFSTGELRILASSGDDDSGVVLRLTRRELAIIDLRDAAKTLYAAWRALEGSGTDR